MKKINHYYTRKEIALLAYEISVKGNVDFFRNLESFNAIDIKSKTIRENAQTESVRRVIGETIRACHERWGISFELYPNKESETDKLYKKTGNKKGNSAHSFNRTEAYIIIFLTLLDGGSSKYNFKIENNLERITHEDFEDFIEMFLDFIQDDRIKPNGEWYSFEQKLLKLPENECIEIIDNKGLSVKLTALSARKELLECRKEILQCADKIKKMANNLVPVDEHQGIVEHLFGQSSWEITSGWFQGEAYNNVNGVIQEFAKKVKEYTSELEKTTLPQVLMKGYRVETIEEVMERMGLPTE